MGVYIKGMEIPEFCAVCTIADWEYDCCPVAYRKNIRITDTSGRPKFCPLVAVPDHRDLIDRDVLMTHKRVTYDIDGHELYPVLTVGTDTILSMRAVIPAERSEE